MVTKSKGSTWDLGDNLVSISILDCGASQLSSDNSAAINTAIGIVGSSGITVYIPDGVYLTAPLTLPTGIIFDGPGTLKLAAGSVNYLITITGSVTLKNIVLDGNNVQVSGGNYGVIAIVGANKVRLEDVVINNALSHGIYIGNASSNIELDGIRVINNLANGILIDSATGVDITNYRCTAPNATAFPGTAISLTSAGNPIKNISITNAVCVGAKGPGIDILGSASRNVTNISISGGTRCVMGSTHGIRINEAEEIIISGSVVANNSGDGIRIEGDTQNVRISTCIANTNTGTGISEVISGSTPNNNGFIYNVQVGNGTNTTTLVGVNSFQV